MGEELSDARIHIGEGRRRCISRPPILRCGCIMLLSPVGGRADLLLHMATKQQETAIGSGADLWDEHPHRGRLNNMHGDDLAGSTHESSRTTYAQDRLKIIRP